MKKRVVISVCVAALVPSLAMAQTYSIGSNPQGSLAYSTAAGIAKVASEDAGIKARVVPQGGPVVTLPRVEKGQLDFSIAVSLVAAFGKEGRAMFKGKKQKNVRIVAALFPLRLGFFVRKDSGITEISQLKGKRLGSKFTKQKVIGITGAAKLATAGLTYKDVKGVPVPNGVRQVDDFMAGKIDAVTFSLASAKTRQANASVGGIRVLSLPNTPKSLAAMQKVAPGSLIQTIQPGAAIPGGRGTDQHLRDAVHPDGEHEDPGRYRLQGRQGAPWQQEEAGRGPQGVRRFRWCQDAPGHRPSLSPGRAQVLQGERSLGPGRGAGRSPAPYERPARQPGASRAPCALRGVSKDDRRRSRRGI